MNSYFMKRTCLIKSPVTKKEYKNWRSSNTTWTTPKWRSKDIQPDGPKIKTSSQNSFREWQSKRQENTWMTKKKRKKWPNKKFWRRLKRANKYTLTSYTKSTWMKNRTNHLLFRLNSLWNRSSTSKTHLEFICAV